MVHLLVTELLRAAGPKTWIWSTGESMSVGMSEPCCKQAVKLGYGGAGI